MGGLERRHALLNTNLTTEEETCKQFLLSLEFRKETLLSFAKLSGLKGPHGSKEDLSGELADAICRDQAPVDQLVIDFCKQARPWLAFFPATLGGPCGPQRTARELFTRFGGKSWYGPFIEDRRTHWLVYCHITPHLVETGQEGDRKIFTKIAARWHLVAKVTGNVVSLHWHNFSYVEDQEEALRGYERQFPYWRHVPDILRRTGELYQATPTEHEDLHTFILHTLYDRYPQSAQTNWQHLKVRALSDGVAMNAGGREEKENSGVQKLTRSLAIAALEELGIGQTEANLRQLDRRLLKTILHEWGVKSYNFTVTTPDKRSFRAHCYFGADDESDTPDAFPHFKTQVDRGGSLAGLDFLLEEMAK